MIEGRVIRNVARYALALTIAASLSACGTWRSQWDSPRSLMERSAPSRVRVVLEDSSRVLLEHPRVVGDSLVGSAESGPRAVPMSEVNHVDVKKGSGLGAAVGVSLFLLGGVLGLFAATWE